MSTKPPVAPLTDNDRWHNAMADLADEFKALFDDDSTAGYKKWDAARLKVEAKITETEHAIAEANWEPDERAEGSDEMAAARLSEARPAPDRDLQSALSALRRIEAMSAANHVCTCGRPTGIGGIQSCANRALSERPLLDADDTTSGFDRALSGHST